jgi:hypothetical protein
MAGDVALGAAPVGSLDRVDPELEIAAAVEDARVDDTLDEVGVLRVDVLGNGIGRGRRARCRARVRCVDGTGPAGPRRSGGQAATASRSEIRLAPVSASKRWSLE